MLGGDEPIYDVWAGLANLLPSLACGRRLPTAIIKKVNLRLEKSFLPAGPSKHCNVEPIRHSVMVRYVDILKDALGRYPDRVIGNYLNALHFARKINEGGFESKGVFSR